MVEKQKITVPPDNYGRVYIALLETKLSPAAKLCYGVMWSFGFESWASLKAIGRRMSMSKVTVIRAQGELEKNRWIVSMGRTEKGCIHWKMRTPIEFELDGQRHMATASPGYQEEGVVQNLNRGGSKFEPGVVQNLNPKQVTESIKNPLRPDGLLKGNTAIAIFIRLRSSWEPYSKEKYRVTGPDKGRLRDLLAGGVLEEEFEAKVRGYLRSQDTFAIAQRHPLSLLCSQYNKWPLADAAASPSAPRLVL